MKDVFVSSIAEFFVAIGSQKAHWYRLFDPGECEANSSLIHATFPSLALLMKMEISYMEIRVRGGNVRTCSTLLNTANGVIQATTVESYADQTWTNKYSTPCHNRYHERFSRLVTTGTNPLQSAHIWN
jgi:hypothetical protein